MKVEYLCFFSLIHFLLLSPFFLLKSAITIDLKMYGKKKKYFDKNKKYPDEKRKRAKFSVTK